MSTLQNICIEVSRQLNDQQRGFEYTRWTREMLINYAYDGLVQVALYRPDAFTNVVEVELKPGVRQQLPPGVFSLASVVDPLNVTEDNIGLLKAFNKKSCSYELDASGNVVYKLSSYFFDTSTPGYFFVSPPVPSGIDPLPRIKIAAVGSPPAVNKTWWLKEMPVDAKYSNAVMAWMQSRAYEVDTESESSFRNMQFQRAEFYKMMGVKYQMESKFNSGWYLGQRGQENAVRGQQ